jgi:hypothetical protein
VSTAKKTKNSSPASVYRLGIGAMVLATAVAMFGLIMPQMSARSEAKAQTLVAETAGADLTAKIAVINAKSSNAEDSLARLQNLTANFPTTYSQAQFFNVLRSAATQSGVTLKGITSTVPGDPASFDASGAAAPTAAPAPAPAPAAGGAATAAPTEVPGADAPAADFPLAQVSISLSVAGDGPSTERFLKNLTNLSRPIIVDSVTVAGDGAVAISGRTYLSRPLVVPTFKK